MGVFGLNDAERRFYRGAAVAAAHELGFVDGDVAAAASRLGLRRDHRLRALAEVLTLEDAWRDPPVASPPTGWGRLAEVIREDRPLDASAALAQFHAHLGEAGAVDARLLAARLAVEKSAPAGLVDLGCGVGVYARAFLDALPEARATLVDRTEVLAMAAPHARARLLAGDLFDVAAGAHGLALLANVVHLYGADDGARLVAHAATLAPTVVVKDFRRGTDGATYFALTMALYTDAGEVHDGARIADWLRAAGLDEVRIEPLGDDLIVVGSRA
ncbi:MAG: O-methyltransferase, family 2:ric methyltransferase [Myxococcales bacterium]|nr:O-methyltransferase, family 2:ric methyltransferase [Myxococcales bacterium]